MDERVSDSEREQTVASLKDDLLSGRLTLEEFSERVEHAYDAVVHSDLDRVRSGLPATDALPAERPKRRATRFTVALLGHAVKRGRLNLRRWTFAVGALCDLDLDLRQAEIHGQRTALTVLVVLGNVDVYVPENVNVTVSGLARSRSPARLGRGRRTAAVTGGLGACHIAVRDGRRVARTGGHARRLWRDHTRAPGPRAGAAAVAARRRPAVTALTGEVMALPTG